MRDLDVRPIGREGGEESGWVLVDYGDLVIHVFDAERRKYYDLDLLWGDTPRIAWQVSNADGGGKVESETPTR